MSEPVLWLVTVLYLGSAASLLWEGKAAMALILVGYAIANVGLILSARG